GRVCAGPPRRWVGCAEAHPTKMPPRRRGEHLCTGTGAQPAPMGCVMVFSAFFRGRLRKEIPLKLKPCHLLDATLMSSDGEVSCELLVASCQSFIGNLVTVNPVIPWQLSTV